MVGAYTSSSLGTMAGHGLPARCVAIVVALALERCVPAGGPGDC
jgi:hypothetical protein